MKKKFLFNEKIKLYNKKVGKNSSTYFIAEIGVNHCNNMRIAKKMVIAAKRAGADAVKFQTFSAEKLVTPKTPKVKYQISNTSKKESHFDMIKSLELSQKQHIELFKFCKKQNINFISTPYDVESAKFLNSLGCKVFKAASADIVDLQLHEYLASTKKAVLISTGMSNFKEIEECLNVYKRKNNKKVVLLHCVSNYPCSIESLNMNVIPKMISRFKTIIGFSDHSLGNLASIVAVSLGARVIEKHFTTDKKLPGPDQKTSILPLELFKLIKDLKNTKTVLGKDLKNCQREELQMKIISRKSLTIKNTLLKGEKINLSNLVLKRPGKGIYYRSLKKIIGKKVKRNLYADHQVSLKDFD